MIRALLVDDEPLGRARLTRLLADHPDVEIVGEAANGKTARAQVLTLRPDLVFLDVQMPTEDGPTALRLLRETVPEGAMPLVVFTTAHAEHAVDAFALEALDYLLKPVERAGLARAMKRVRKRVDGAPAAPAAPGPGGRLMAHRGTRTIPLEIDTIAAVVVEDRIAWAWTPAGRFRLGGTLREVEEQLPDDFFQVSRAAIVRPSWITALKPLASGTFEATLRDVEGELHVSRRRARELKPLLTR